MEKKDLKNVLKEGKKETKEEVTVKKHKKPIQLRDIENRSSSSYRNHSKNNNYEEIDNLLNKEKTDIFKKPWNHLDTGMKLNRIRLFSETESCEKELSDDKKEALRKIIADACVSNKLNKVTDVEYDIEECKIISIKNLVYKNGNYHLKINEVKKVKKPTKSKSNIDRFISRKC